MLVSVFPVPPFMPLTTMYLMVTPPQTYENDTQTHYHILSTSNSVTTELPAHPLTLGLTGALDTLRDCLISTAEGLN